MDQSRLYCDVLWTNKRLADKGNLLVYLDLGRFNLNGLHRLYYGCRRCLLLMAETVADFTLGRKPDRRVPFTLDSIGPLVLSNANK